MPHPSTYSEIELNGETLCIEQVIAVARYRARVRLAEEARRRVKLCRRLIEHMVTREIKVYGLTTGFGSKRDVFIDARDTIQLQSNLIQSHAAGVGSPLPEDVVRAAILLRASTLARGNSGIRLEVLEKLLELLNRDVYPYIPDKGSVGASGDLAPLSHLTLVLIGDPLGRVYQPPAPDSATETSSSADPTTSRLLPELDRRRHAGVPYQATAPRATFVPSTRAHLSQHFGFVPVALEAKEGLALNNGTQIMTAVAALTLYDAELLTLTAEVTAAASIEALKGVTRAFEAPIHEARPHPGQLASAQNLRALLDGSRILRVELNTARTRRGLLHIKEALSRLEFDSASALKPLRPQLQNAANTLAQVLTDPEEALAHARSSVLLRQSACLSTMELERAAAREALTGVKRDCLTISAELLKAELAEDILPARDSLTSALNELEQAVPSRPRVQDDYSLRCTPQVLGAARDALLHARRVVTTELTAATDNPLIFPPKDLLSPDCPDERWQTLSSDECLDAVCSGGNFHGEPIGMVMDYVKVALAEIGSLSERRVAHMVDGHLNQGLPSLLIERSGLNSGLMIPQYTAAALVSENKVLAHPATVDSIPTCENTEDHVSMGTIAARQAREILHNVELVLAIECLTAYQGLRFRAPLQAGPGGQALEAAMHMAGASPIADDRVLYPEIERACQMIRREALLDAANERLKQPLRGLEPAPAAKRTMG